ncbi:MAG: SWF/SNF helicase family protein, partial [Planctomycetes bacterium]|nr:SWF/SNF helicase family protein [Planctomycetota bacterium]
YCRSLITIDMLLYLCNEQEASSCTFGALASIPTVSSCRTRRKKTKATAIYEILSSKPQGKFILFSQTNDTFVVIRRLLQDFDIPFVELCGGMASRQRKLESFKTGSCPVLFLTSLIHCAGMNLQEASDIIFYHRIYEAVQNQVVKRAHRIGQDKEIVVHHLI